MPFSYVIDPEQRLVTTVASGVLRAADIASLQENLRKDPAFDQTFRQMGDFTQVSGVEVDSASISLLARVTVFAPDARRAFLVKNDLEFGLARMFESYVELDGGRNLRIFRDRTKATEWIFGDGQE